MAHYGQLQTLLSLTHQLGGATPARCVRSCWTPKNSIKLVSVASNTRTSHQTNGITSGPDSSAKVALLERLNHLGRLEVFPSSTWGWTSCDLASHDRGQPFSSFLIPGELIGLRQEWATDSIWLVQANPPLLFPFGMRPVGQDRGKGWTREDLGCHRVVVWRMAFPIPYPLCTICHEPQVWVSSAGQFWASLQLKNWTIPGFRQLPWNLKLSHQTLAKVGKGRWEWLPHRSLELIWHTLFSPNGQPFLSLGPGTGQLYSFLPAVKSPPGEMTQSWQSSANISAPSPLFLNHAKGQQQLGKAGAGGVLSTQWDHEKLQGGFFLSSIRGALTEGHVGKSHIQVPLMVLWPE